MNIYDYNIYINIKSSLSRYIEVWSIPMNHPLQGEKLQGEPPQFIGHWFIQLKNVL